jgi:hypothetical protein
LACGFESTGDREERFLNKENTKISKKDFDFYQAFAVVKRYAHLILCPDQALLWDLSDPLFKISVFPPPFENCRLSRGTHAAIIDGPPLLAPRNLK